MTLVAYHVGQPGFVAFARALRNAGVLSQGEFLNWLELHGSILRLDPPLEGEEGFDEDAFAELERALGERA